MSELPDETNPFAASNRPRLIALKRERPLIAHQYAGFVPYVLFRSLLNDADALRRVSDVPPLSDQDRNLCARITKTVTAIARCAQLEQQGEGESYWTTLLNEAVELDAADLLLLPLRTTFFDVNDRISMYNAQVSLYSELDYVRAVQGRETEPQLEVQMLKLMVDHTLESFQRFQEALFPELKRRGGGLGIHDYVTVQVQRGKFPKDAIAHRVAVAQNEVMTHLFGRPLVALMRKTDPALFGQLSTKSLDFACMRSDSPRTPARLRAAFVSYSAMVLSSEGACTQGEVKMFIFDAEQTLREQVAEQQSIDADFAAIMDRLSSSGFDNPAFKGDTGTDPTSGFDR